MRISFYLDARRGTTPYPVKLMLRRRGATAMVSTGIKVGVKQWDAHAERVVKHPSSLVYNSFLQHLMLDVGELVLSSPGKSVTEVKDLVQTKFFGAPESNQALFIPFFRHFAETRIKSRTRAVYEQTLQVLYAWRGQELDALTFDGITRRWLEDFDNYCAAVRGNMVNTRAIHLRNIRAVINAALDDGLTTSYPFRRFKIKHAPTMKRSLSVAQMRTLWLMTPQSETQQWALDVFCLSFALLGINLADLAGLRKSDLSGGRLCYKRAKTGHVYDIKVEPEAEELIRRLESTSDKGYLLDILDWHANVHAAVCCINKRLHELLPDSPGLTTYWARHSWATIAAGLDVPKETIAAGLGHSASSVTDIYVTFDNRKVDAANRRVLDLICQQSF